MPAERDEMRGIRRGAFAHHWMISDVIERQTTNAVPDVAPELRRDTTLIPLENFKAELGGDGIAGHSSSATGRGETMKASCPSSFRPFGQQTAAIFARGRPVNRSKPSSINSDFMARPHRPQNLGRSVSVSTGE